MIEFFHQQLASEKSQEAKINRLRELLQLLCLKIMHDKGWFANLVFTGGTALRLIYDMKRFSEGLDFSLIKKEGYDFEKIVASLEYEFKLRGLTLEPKSKIVKTMQSSMLKIPKLLKLMGLSGLQEQKLSIKLEVDSNPPFGGEFEKTLINNVYMLNMVHFTLSSLFATKLHACFFRKYVKGRDFYDLVWYLGKKIKPNYKLLNNAIKQTQGKDFNLSEHNIVGFLLKRLEEVDFKFVKKDVERFLEDKDELQLLDKEIILKSVKDVF